MSLWDKDRAVIELHRNLLEFYAKHQNQPASIDDLCDFVVIWAESQFGSDELVRAQNEFHEKTGKSFPDDVFYESRMGYFLDHFIFARRLSDEVRIRDFATPFQVFLHLIESIDIPSSLAESFAKLTQFRHSVFEILQVEEFRMSVRDLLDGDKFTVSAQPSQLFHGYKKGDLIQGYLFVDKPVSFLSRGVLCHPASVNRAVQTIMISDQNYRFNRPDLLNHLAGRHMRHLRHRHVEAKNIYLG